MKEKVLPPLGIPEKVLTLVENILRATYYVFQIGVVRGTPANFEEP